MGAAASITFHKFHNTTPKFIKIVIKNNVDEKVKQLRQQGTFGYAFVGETKFYKINQCKTQQQAEIFCKHVMDTRAILPNEDCCHALSSKVIGDCVLSSFPRYDADLHSMSYKCDFDSLHRTLLHLLESLCYMHACGVVHGDIKPENILVSAYGRPPVFGDLDNLRHPTTDLRSIGTEKYAPRSLGLVREAISMIRTKEATPFEVYAFLDLYAFGKTVQTVLDRQIHVKNLHIQRFWLRIIELYTGCSLRHFFMSDYGRKIRAVSCVELLEYFNVRTERRLQCDCPQRPEWHNGCILCEDNVDDIRIPERPPPIRPPPIQSPVVCI